MEQNLSNKGEQLVKKRIKWKRWKRVFSVLACFVVFCTTYALILPAITVEKKAYCGYEEHAEHSAENGCFREKRTLICQQPEKPGHQHTDACYQMVSTLICGMEESEEHTHTDACYSVTTNLICGQEESTGHQHTDACYTFSQELICTLPIHSHTKNCYGSDSEEGKSEVDTSNVSNADVETKKDWEATLKDVKLTGDWAEDLLAVAESQLGYKESTANYIATNEGRKGYTRYGAWYGNEYGDWCAMYVSFCLHYAEIDKELMPREANCQRWINILTEEDDLDEDEKEHDYHYYKNDEYVPKVGDLIFFDWDDYKEDEEETRVSDHIGIVAELIYENSDKYEDIEEVDPDDLGDLIKIKTIEGNSSDRVQYVTYKIDDDTIMGYAELPENPNPVEDEENVSADDAAESKEAEKTVEKTYEGPDYVITASYTKDAGIPEDAEFKAEEISQDSEEYKLHLEEAEQALNTQTDETITFARFFDIEFLADSEKIEPQAAVSISISYKDKVELQDDSQVAVVHFAEEGIEILDVETSLEEKDTDTEEPESEEALEVDTFNFTQESFSITGTVVTGTTVAPGEYIIYTKSGNNYYALARDGEAVEVTVTNGVVSCNDDDANIVWNVEGVANGQMYISNGTGADKVYLSLTGTAEGSILGVDYITNLTSTNESGVRYQAVNNGAFRLSSPEYALYLMNNRDHFTGSANQRYFIADMYFASYTPEPEEGTAGEYYKLVNQIESGKDYLIVSVEGNYALTATSNTAVGATALKLNPVKGNPGVYNIAGVSDSMFWDFPGAKGGAQETTLVSHQGHNLRLSSYSRYDLALVDDNDFSASVVYHEISNSWTIRRSGSNYVAYLYINNGTFDKQTNGTAYTNNMLILEKVDPPTIPSDPIGTDADSAGGTGTTIPKPSYPDTVVPSGAKVEDTSFTNADGEEIEDIIGTAYSDRATSNLEDRFAGVETDDGKVLSDKSVIYGDDDYGAFFDSEENNFSITLSLLAQEYPLEELKNIPTPIDVVFVLDVSGSMQNTTPSGKARRVDLVNAVNHSMDDILSQHPENRVGVVVYSSGSWDLLDIDHYSPGNNDEYLTITNTNNNVYSANNLKNSKNETVTRKTDSNQQHGTYTQSGIARGAAMFERVEDTTYTTEIELGGMKKEVTVERQPVIILLSDGDPTHCTSNYMDVLSGPHYGNGTYPEDTAKNNNGIQGYYTILSANYYKQMVGIHYNVPAKFFTVGMGINAEGIDDYSKQSATGDHYKRAVLNPSPSSIADLDLPGAKNREITAIRLKNLLNNAVDDQYISVGSNNQYSALGTTNTHVPVLKNPYSDYAYADDAYFGNISEADLKKIFSDIIASSHHVKEYGFILVKRSTAMIRDTIGDGMEITSGLVLNYGGINYHPTNITSTDDGKETTYVYDYLYEANDGSGWSAELNEILVKVIKEDDGQETVILDCPDEVLPVFIPCEVPGNDWYYQALPVRLIYQVGLTEESKEEVSNLKPGETRSFLTNRYEPSNEHAGCYGTIHVEEHNPYFNGDGEGHNVQFEPYHRDKLITETEDPENPIQANVSGTNTVSHDAKWGHEEFMGDDDALYVHNHLYNNGRLTFGRETTTVNIAIEKVDMQDDLITSSEATFEIYNDEELADRFGSYSTVDGRVEVKDLILGNTYYLKEVKAPDGYTVLDEVKSFKVETVTLQGESQTVITGIATGDTYLSVKDNSLVIQVRNSDGYELPHTGGVGTILYTLGGVMLMIISLLYGLLLRRRRERRLI